MTAGALGRMRGAAAKDMTLVFLPHFSMRLNSLPANLAGQSHPIYSAGFDEKIAETAQAAVVRAVDVGYDKAQVDFDAVLLAFEAALVGLADRA